MDSNRKSILKISKAGSKVPDKLSSSQRLRSPYNSRVQIPEELRASK